MRGGEDFGEIEEDGIGLLAGFERAELRAFAECVGGTLGRLMENFGGGGNAAGSGE